MSDGKMFNLSAEENEQISIIRQKYQEAIGKLDAIEIKIKNAFIHFDSIDSNLKDNKETFSDLLKRFNEMSSGLSNHIFNTNSKHSDLTKDVLSLTKDKKTLQDGQELLKQNLAYIDTENKKAMKSQDSLVNLASFNQMISRLELLEKSLAQVKQDNALNSSHASRIGSLEAFRTEYRGDKFHFDKHIKTSNDKITSIEDLIKAESRKAQEYVHSFKENVLSNVDQKLSAIQPIEKKEKIEQTELGKIYSKIELASLDSSNAVLKSNNSAQQITLLEKKIENIFLLLKKHELTQ